ncbi:hypothetical protein GLT92_00825 [Nanohaloarchaea archaeon]|nr:hypothetical protein [Candidatus Nanohaloarchaea archaeon]NMJ92738.1 hypothetical protein [Candidatus Nanohaloarchaea archaeon]
MESEKDSPEFGYTFYTEGRSDWESEVRNGTIRDLEDVRDEDVGPGSIKGLMGGGDSWKTLKVKSGTQGGAPYGLAIDAPDNLDDDLEYTVEKVEESVYVSPQSQVHNQLMQQKQNAEQRVKETKRNLSELLKQKHMLEHDIRKLRSRVEDIKEGNETRIKADFVELVDGAGASGQGGGDRAALKFLRDQNIYPSIVANFNEMESLDDLKPEDEGGTGKLSHLPENIKAVLKKKYAMYEKWKDLFGSEIERKLDELKGELQGIERAIEETEEYLEPYVRDMEMVNNKSQSELADDLRRVIQLRGYSSLFTTREYIAYRGLKNTGDDVVVTDDEDEITHYRLVYIFMAHANLASGEDPSSPQGGSDVVKVFWYPAIVDEFVFERIFKARIDEVEEDIHRKIKEYTGEMDTKKGKKLSNARTEKGMSVADLRQEIGDELDRKMDIDVSAKIRRVEDGLDEIGQQFSKEEIEAIDEILGTSLTPESQSSEEFVTGVNKKLKQFTGQVDDYGIDASSAHYDLDFELKKRYYFDLKIGLGLFTKK